MSDSETKPEAKPEPTGESRLRAALTIYFPMFIAVLSLVTAIYNGYLNNRFVNLIQGNVGRVEYMKTCRDIIDAYFQVKFRADLLRLRAEGDGAKAAAASAERIEALNAVTKFGALGTYLANLRNEDIRRDYTHLAWELQAVVERAGKGEAEPADTLFAKADPMFSALNDDCIKSAKDAPL